MTYDAFVQQVQAQAGLGEREAAERLIQATLSTLGERLYRSEQSSLGAQLPAELKAILAERSLPETTRRHTDRFDLEEFYTRISARAGIGLSTAERQASVVMKALRAAASPGALDQLLAALPGEYAKLF